MEKLMKQYDFKSILDRSGSGSEKWDEILRFKPDVSSGIVPFTMADMEWKNAPEIIEGLKKYIDSYPLGYSCKTKGYIDAVCGWMKRRHQWEIKDKWIVETDGILSALFAIVQKFTEPGDGVIILSPVFFPFEMAATTNQREIVRSSLIHRDKKYSIDFDDLEQKASEAKNKIMIFCNPHNPIGRVWTPEELRRVGEICIRNNVLIVSDEIHNDLIMPGYKHTVFATLSEELADNMIVCTAPSKTFNLAGLQAANIIISNPKIREAFSTKMTGNGFFMLGSFGYRACEIAYTQCEEWLDQCIQQIHSNHLVLKQFIESHIPQIQVYDLEATYLQWMDLRDLGYDQDTLVEKLHGQAEVFFDEGYVFGPDSYGFERMNIACPEQVMLDALKRMERVFR